MNGALHASVGRDVTRSQSTRQREPNTGCDCDHLPPHTIVELTGPHPVRIDATGPQDLRLAMDVSDFDELDLEFRVIALDGTDPTIQLTIETGMQCATDHGWTTLATFPLVSTAPATHLRRLRGMLRYIRWHVTTLGGTTPAAIFLLDGVARAWPTSTAGLPARDTAFQTAGPLQDGAFAALQSEFEFSSWHPFGDWWDAIKHFIDFRMCKITGCPHPLKCCPRESGGWTCADTDWDPYACGPQCNECPFGQICFYGECVDPCKHDLDCPLSPQQFCAEGEGGIRGCLLYDCPNGQCVGTTCCSGYCVPMSGLANCGYCGNTASCVGKDNCIAAGCCHMTAYGAYTPVWAYANKSLNAFFCACQKSKPGFHMGQQTAIIPNELCP